MKKIIIILFGVVLAGCGEQYKDLESHFGSNDVESGELTTINTMTVYSANRKGIFNLRETVNVRMSENSINVSVAPPFGWYYDSISIPASEVSGCGKSCFSNDNWYGQLYISKTGTEVGFHNSKTLVNWCWKNKIPIIPGDVEREWKYKGGELPPKETYFSQFESIDKYIHLAKQSCLGY